MRNLKFALSAAAILLVGAVAVGLAARAVVSPRVEEIRSAGVVAIPTVLGQTAEEVLFYPWSMYDTQPLRHLTEDELLFLFEMDGWEVGMAEIVSPNEKLAYWPFLLLDGFRLIRPVDLSPDGILTALEWNINDQGLSPSYGTHIFLKDFPVTACLGEEGTETPVTLDFALGTGLESSVSFLMKPAQARELTGGEQAAALERVEQDLRLMLLPANPSNSGLYWLLQMFHDCCNWARVMTRNPFDLFVKDRLMLTEWLDTALEDPYEAPMEEFLSAVEQFDLWNIQIITTQQQIVALFTGNSGVVFGVYYDIQLGCYSGIGLTG